MASIPRVGGIGVALVPLLQGEHRSPDPTEQTTNLRRWEETLQGNMSDVIKFGAVNADRDKEAPRVPGVCFYVCKDPAWFRPFGPYARRLCTSPRVHTFGTFDTDVTRRTAYRRRRNSCTLSVAVNMVHRSGKTNTTYCHLDLFALCTRDHSRRWRWERPIT